MPCQFSLGYSSSFEPASFHDPRAENAFGNQCQFHMFDEEHMSSFSGKTWCPFHLPVTGPDGEESVKKAWDFKTQAVLSSFLAEYIEERRLSEKPIDLAGLVHWDRLTLSMSFSPELQSGVSTQGKKYPSISLEGAEFPRGVDFSGCTFSKSFHAKNAYFGDQANFSGSAFQGPAYFSSSEFKKEAQFTKSKFESSADFSGARFQGAAFFFDVEFGGAANFALNTQFSFVPSLDPDESLRHAVFVKCRFHAQAIFNDRKFLSGPDFSLAEFDIAPEFHNCQIHQSANFEGAVFRDVESPGADRSYRTLKLALEKLGARDEQSMFFALEQKARAKKPSTPVSIRFFSELYRIVSDYGQDFVMPLVFMFILTIGFTVLYAMTIPSAMVNGPHCLVGLLTFSFEQIIRPFSIWSSTYKPELVESKMSLVLRLLSTLHALGAIGLVTISLLALRRRFKLD
jgi:uncharacterized protein YjbI with pentapeptide repeats